jgi:hypothetical protein
MRTTIAILGALVLAGCGGGDKTYSVGGNTLTVRDQGYYYTDGTDYCATGGLGQMMLDFVDYNYICDPSHTPQKDATGPHAELRIILTVGLASQGYPTHPNMGLPYDSTPGVTPNCTAGSGGTGDLIIGEFLHYPNGNDGTPPDSIQYATSAHLLFTQFDKTKMKPNQGNFDLKFGATELKDSFSIDSCN